MFAAVLNSRIVIQQPTFSVGVSGEPEPVWTTYAAVAARAEPTKGREFFAAAGIHADEPMLFVIWYKAGITPLMRVSFKDRNYEIKSVVDYRELKREMHLYCIGMDQDDAAPVGLDYVLQKERRHEWTEAYDYCGRAPLNSAESAEAWLIYRLLITSDGDSSYDVATDVKWTERVTATYV